MYIQVKLLVDASPHLNAIFFYLKDRFHLVLVFPSLFACPHSTSVFGDLLFFFKAVSIHIVAEAIVPHSYLIHGRFIQALFYQQQFPLFPYVILLLQTRFLIATNLSSDKQYPLLEAFSLFLDSWSIPDNYKSKLT